MAQIRMIMTIAKNTDAATARPITAFSPYAGGGGVVASSIKNCLIF